MANNGLKITEDEFSRMPTRDKFLCLYKNQLVTLETVKSYKFYYKLTSTLAGFLSTGLGFLYYYIFVLHN